MISSQWNKKKENCILIESKIMRIFHRVLFLQVVMESLSRFLTIIGRNMKFLEEGSREEGRISQDFKQNLKIHLNNNLLRVVSNISKGCLPRLHLRPLVELLKEGQLRPQLITQHCMPFKKRKAHKCTKVTARSMICSLKDLWMEREWVYLGHLVLVGITRKVKWYLNLALT